MPYDGVTARVSARSHRPASSADLRSSTLYSADFIGNPGNCSYPHKTVVMDTDSLKAAVSHDYVCVEYKHHSRNGANFLSTDCLPVDCDNDHSEDPKDWITPADVLEAFPGVSIPLDNIKAGKKIHREDRWSRCHHHGT